MILDIIGEMLQDWGKQITPVSFWFALAVRLLITGWRKNNYYYIFNGVKFTWYILQGILILSDDAFVERVVMYICFIEAFDHLLIFLANKPKKAQAKPFK